MPVIGSFFSGLFDWFVSYDDTKIKLAEEETKRDRARLNSLPSAFKEVKDFLAFRYDAQNQSLGVRIGKPILYNKIEQIPDQVLKDTKFNYEEVKWFKFNGINVGQRQVLIRFRLRKKHWEDAWINRVLIYDNAADVYGGINLEVKNRVIKAHPYIHKVDADWASGILGWVASFGDLVTGSLNWLFTGDFNTFTNQILNIVAGVLGSQISLKDALTELNDLNQSGFIYLDKTDYDDQGVWLVFKLDDSRLDASIPRLEAWVYRLLNS